MTFDADAALAAFSSTPKQDDARKRKRYERERKRLGLSVEPMTVEQKREKKSAYKKRKKSEQLEYIAVLDLETDPFDANLRERIFPFVACLYSDKFHPIIIWEENEKLFVDKLIEAINGLPNSFTIYAHNGGKFDFLFLINRLRGRVSFKERGLMAAKIGSHDLRDSLHIIPEKLAAYRKEEFDYKKLTKGKRAANRQEIIDYLLSDCVYLFDIVKTFVKNYGMKISIGQAAMHLLKQEYPECKNLTAPDDEFLRNFFFGGRVECFAGCTHLTGDYKLFDVNSMYPYVMAKRLHPIGGKYTPYNRGDVTERTCFIDLECYSDGAFPVRVPGEGTQFPRAYGRYRASIHEYVIALKYGLIKNANILYTVECDAFSNFSNFILPLYNNRLLTKEKLKKLEINSEEYLETKKDDIFFKLLMNNAYGKFAQNPRRFREYYITDWNGVPDEETETWGEYPDELCADYAIWSRPIKRLRFNNVGTAASITGAARAVLLEAKMNSTGAVYCDTDSLICKSLFGVEIHETHLGAWDLEANISEIMIAGKKLYGYKKQGVAKPVIKSKGTRGLTWDGLKSLINGGDLIISAFAPTLTRTGQQRYIDRRIHATVK